MKIHLNSDRPAMLALLQRGCAQAQKERIETGRMILGNSQELYQGDQAICGKMALQQSCSIRPKKWSLHSALRSCEAAQHNRSPGPKSSLYVPSLPDLQKNSMSFISSLTPRHGR
jgi:hypothetical protein